MKFALISFSALLVVAPVAASPLRAQGGQQANVPQTRPLERLAAEQMLVLPVQYLTFADSLGWSQGAPSSGTYLSTVDDEIAFALKQRGLKGRWTLAPDIIRSVERNPGYAPDPRSLAATEIRWGQKEAGWELREPLASQLRALIALTDARYVLFPVELRIVGSKGVGHAMLHLVIIDARRSQVQWSGDLAGADATKFSPAIAADIASRLADLIAAPVN
ncbi:MAG TPA: hypothetical protein VIC03_04310 [Gemmatimonadaceae bacterium]|jgi:hypothetical protein